ncbi:MAG: hypothetical protein AAGC93_29545 [Cyanobacteria bacterium P01_F01_bin.53]
MKFWLACFVLLFAGAELFQWVAQLGELSGAWLVLGGMGLAAASNAKHLPMMGKHKAVPLKSKTEQVVQSQTASNESVTVADSLQTQPSPSTTETSSGPLQETSSSLSDQDSISFKVRLPWF